MLVSGWGRIRAARDWAAQGKVNYSAGGTSGLALGAGAAGVSGAVPIRAATSGAANMPRAIFTKRVWSPLVPISRRIAEYSVAAGGLPPGLGQEPLMAMMPTIS